MEKLQELMEQQNFKEVIKLCQTSDDIVERFYLVSAYLGNNELLKALDEIDSHQEQFEKWNQLKTMKIHFTILKEIHDLKRSQKALDHYENLPYVNQECEEFLRYWSTHFIDDVKPKYKEYDVNSIVDILKNEINEQKICQIFNYIEDYLDRRLLDTFLILFKREDISRTLKVVALFELLNNKVDLAIEFPYKDTYKKYDLKVLRTIDFNINANKIAGEIAKLTISSPNIGQFANELLMKYALNFIPEDLSDDINLFAEAFISLAKDALGIKEEVNSKIKELKSQIKSILEK